MPIPLTDDLYPMNLRRNPPEIRIRPVTSRWQRRAFIKFPWKIYRGDPHWVPPLIGQLKETFDPRKNPFYEHADIQLFLADRGDRPVGRIAAVVNHAHNEFHDERTGFFGFFECVNDPEAAGKLLGAAREWLRQRGMETFRGPANFSSNDEWGLLVQGFDMSPVLMMPYNPPYYPGLLEGYGLTKAKDLYAYRMIIEEGLPERLRRMAAKIEQREGLTIRPIDMKDFDNELKRIKVIYNNAWSKNWGFVPMTEAAGFSLTLPDYNQALKHLNGRLFPFGILKLLWHSRRIDHPRILVMGVVHEYQRRGIDAVFYVKTWDAGEKRGYTWGEMSWILEDNEMMKRAMELMGGKIYKTYRIYESDVREK